MEPSSNLKQLQLLITLVEKAEQGAGNLIIIASEVRGHVTQGPRKDGNSPNVFAWTGPHLELRLTQPGAVSEKMALTWRQGSVG